MQMSDEQTQAGIAPDPRVQVALERYWRSNVRIMAALLENNQTPEGIRIPEVLHPYMGTGNEMIT